MTEYEWKLGNDVVDELNKYKDRGVVKNLVSSSSQMWMKILERPEKGWNDFFI